MPRIEAPLPFLGSYYTDPEYSDNKPESAVSAPLLGSPLIQIAQCWWESGYRLLEATAVLEALPDSLAAALASLVRACEADPGGGRPGRNRGSG
eukprot:CAMPEP_0172184422 /NCGR_PEP_ID=MMETSP1050-20130122/19570_1 /TAXON_ID=233186 /ORGANISM="Cryptomonas curvata, Strain CCAP979/52" /LENGTH=93 /DNA_ID=CAMNT_0012858225 /DNA_START=497 /DNA_END=775 /DNA_ORIENTATION=+